MQANVTTWTVKEMARTLGVSCSGYYRHCRGKVGKRQQENERLLKAIRRIFLKSRQTYGSPRIHAELREQGYRCSRQRVARLMKQAGFIAKGHVYLK
jgi:putative transposase